MRTAALLMVVMTALWVPAAGQERGATERSVFDDYLNPIAPASGFLHVPGLEFGSSVGFSYVSSGAYGSDGMGYYMGHFSYRLASSLTLRWDVGVGTALSGPDGMGEHRILVPNVDLTYRPSDRFMMRLQFRQGAFGNPWTPGLRRR